MRVSIYGAGQAGSAVAALLRTRDHVVVEGPFGRDERSRALTGGADVVVIATTSFLAGVADDVRAAIASGSNVLTTAEEAAHPWATDAALAHELDLLAREHGVTVLGAGLNPGLAFDALVLTVAGASAEVVPLRVERTVDLSGFGRAVLRRIGVGHTPAAFAAGVADGTITGHIGFPQSMRLVAAALGVEIERIDRELAPVFAAGESVGFEQRYVAVVGGAPWFTAVFSGHTDPARPTHDAIRVACDPPIDLRISPGIDAQKGSAAVLANSVARVAAAPAGWLTVADLPPAVPS
jgi:4-hydroxy-tetrahydrodipicolinate reductase